MEHFLHRFMGDKRDKKWPEKQRAAIGYSEYRERNKKKKSEHAA